MKKINIILAISLIFSLVSCDKFLDIKPVGKVIPTTLQDYRDLMTYAYDNLPSDRAIAGIRGDELSLIKGSTDSYLAYKSIYLWEDLNPDPSTNAYPWQSFYKAILNANQVIEAKDKMEETTAEELSQLVGEAYLLRAYLHFGLVNLYSDVYNSSNANKKSIPVALKIDIWQSYPRSTISEVYKQIISDIEKGTSLLNVKEQAKGTNYRFSKVSAYGFAARVYLYMQNWAKAAEYAQKAYSINNNLEDLNIADAKLPTNFQSVENVLAMEQTFSSGFKYRFDISQELINAYNQDNDLRFAKYFKKSGSNYKTNLGAKDENKVSMRTAEFYLILAEANARTAKTTDARTYIKALLSKRLKPAYYTIEAAKIDAMDDKALIQKVTNERFKELACQGFRWYDLRRNGKIAISKTFDGKKYDLKKDDNRYVVPFPKEAVDNNPNLVN